MKKLITILCLVLLSSCSQDVIPEVETVTRDGLVYHQLSTEPLTGTVVSFHENGQLWWRKNYMDGEPDGLWEWFHENGQLKERRNYKDGKRDGLWEWFYENGQLWWRGNYIDGERDGLHEFFDNEDGNLTRTRTYKDGELVEPLTGIAEEFHDNGQLQYRGNYKDGKRDGLFEEFYYNGQLRERGNWIDGKLDGLRETFYENGNLTKTGTWRNGELVEGNLNP